VPQACGFGDATVESGQVMAQSTPSAFESLLTTGENCIPVVLPTGTLVLDGAGLRAIETAGGLEEELLLLPLHAIEVESAAIISRVRIRREAKPLTS